MLGILLAVAVIAILVLARLWMRRTRDDDDEVPETREIDRGDRESGPAPRRRGRFLRRPTPRDAAAAYRMLLEDLDEHPALRREEGETPAEHAARLRAAGHGRLALEPPRGGLRARPVRRRSGLRARDAARDRPCPQPRARPAAVGGRLTLAPPRRSPDRRASGAMDYRVT